MNAVKADKRRDKRRAESLGRQLALLLWVKAAAQWLADNRADVAEAAVFAREDGLAFATPRRISLAYAKALRDDPNLPRPAPVRDKRSALSRVQWERLETAIRRRINQNMITHDMTVAEVARDLDAHHRIRRPVVAVDESLKACGWRLPMRRPRPKFS